MARGEHCITDRVMAKHSVTIPTTPHMVIAERVSSYMTDGTLQISTVDRKTEPALETHTKLAVEEMQTKGPGGNGIESVSRQHDGMSMRE